MNDFRKRHLRCTQIPYEGGIRISRHDLDCKHRDEHEEATHNKCNDSALLELFSEIGDKAAEIEQDTGSEEMAKKARLIESMSMDGTDLVKQRSLDAQPACDACKTPLSCPRCMPCVRCEVDDEEPPPGRPEAQNNPTLAQAVEYLADPEVELDEIIRRHWDQPESGHQRAILADLVGFVRRRENEYLARGFDAGQRRSEAQLEGCGRAVETDDGSMGARCILDDPHPGPCRSGLEQPTAAELLRQGGEWLGAARKWLQWNTRNGDQVTWGSGDLVEPQLSVRQIEDLAAEVAAAAMRPQPSEQRLANALKARWKAEAELAELRSAAATAVAVDGNAWDQALGRKARDPGTWTKEAWEAVADAIPWEFGSGNLGSLAKRMRVAFDDLRQFEEDIRGWSKSDGRLLEHVTAACESLDQRRAAAKAGGGT